MARKRILVAALNWGLGHASRCIPIIKALETEGFEPILASDGAALKLLQLEFPDLTSIELPSYNISYSKQGGLLKWKIILNSPRILKAILAEKRLCRDLVKKYNLKGIISDNRLGVRTSGVPSVFITHQLNVLSGNTTKLSSIIHQKYISKFEECWVPDFPGEKNLSGRLGHPKLSPNNVKYIGPLSRFRKTEFPKKYEVLVLLSGPEPQRSILEELLLMEFIAYDKACLFVRGSFSAFDSAGKYRNPKLQIIDHLLADELETAINSAEIVVCRSGYSSIMDLVKLKKKAFFIPTPGQYEQLYLANRMQKLGLAAYCRQENFSVKKLEEVKNYSGLGGFGDFGLPVSLFRLFESK